MESKKFYLRPEFWIGGIALIAGSIHFIHKLDIPLQQWLESYWPVIFIITGIFQFSSTRYRDTVSIMVLIVIGTVLLLFKGGIMTTEIIREQWPASLKQLFNTLFNYLIFMKTFIFQI